MVWFESSEIVGDTNWTYPKSTSSADGDEPKLPVIKAIFPQSSLSKAGLHVSELLYIVTVGISLSHNPDAADEFTVQPISMLNLSL